MSKCVECGVLPQPADRLIIMAGIKPTETIQGMLCLPQSRRKK